MSEKHTFTGQVVHIGEIQEFGGKGFYKRDLVLSDGADKYPQEIAFQCSKERADAAGEYGIGDTVKVDFNLRGRAWNGRWFVNLEAWRLELQESAGGAAKQDELPPLDEEDDSIPPF